MEIRCTQADHRNQQIIGFCIDSTCPNQRPYCNFCLPLHSEHLHMLTSLELLYEWIQQGTLNVQSVEKNVKEFKVALDGLLNLFLPYANFNIQQFPSLGVSQIDKFIKDLSQMEDCQKILFKQLKQLIEQGKSIINEILKQIKNQTNLKPNNNLQVPHQQSNQMSILKPNLNPFTFVLINQNSIKQEERCNALAFNKDCSIVASGCETLIKIYKFKQGLMKQIQVLNDHKKNVTTLNFMKKSNQFISGDEGGSILIWSNNNNNQWNCSQNIQGHKDRIECLIMNKKEDLFISSSDDKTIKFWIKSKEWICQQTITNHTDIVFQLSLNEQQNQVISCGRDQLILIIEYSEESKKWIVVQNIKGDCWGSRLCFINDNLFTFQPYKGNLMYVYEMNSGSKQFKKTKDITVNEGNDNYTLFPQQYIKSKQLLVSKHHNYINLIRKTENDEFQVQQSIQFGEKMLYGQMSDDGEYLITWDISSEEIQIRRCKEE